MVLFNLKTVFMCSEGLDLKNQGSWTMSTHNFKQSILGIVIKIPKVPVKVRPCVEWPPGQDNEARTPLRANLL